MSRLAMDATLVVFLALTACVPMSYVNGAQSSVIGAPTRLFPVAWNGNRLPDSEARVAVAPQTKSNAAESGDVVPTTNPRQTPIAVPAKVGVPRMVGKRLAVLEFSDTGLQPAILRVFSDSVRSGVLVATRGSGLLVMTRESMFAVLKDMGKTTCTEGDCEVETARNIGADLVISGEAVLIEQTYFVTLKLHESQRGNLLATDTVQGKDQVDLVEKLRSRSAEMVLQGLTTPQ